jgi:hypothetical protein
MKKGYFRYGLLLILVGCLFAFPIGCGSAGGSGNIDDPTGEEEVAQPSGEEGAVEGEVEEPVESVAASVNVTVNPATISVEGSAQVTADVRDAGNNPVPDGTTVTYSLASSAWGTITSSSTTNGGIATATFTAANQPGATQITASSGGASGSGGITIEQVPAAAIQFVSADPSVISLAGTAGDTISEIQFIVLDSNGNPLEGIDVTFALVVGPGGGEYIQPASTSTNSVGIAMVRLYSGSVAGPVTVSATTNVGDPPVPATVQTTGVSIGGGVPSDARFSVTATRRNLAGLSWNGIETDVSAWLADRFGSYNILKGTTVSFGTEVGITADTSSVTLADDGVATVTVRTQQGAGGAHAKDVLPLTWEEDLQTYLAGAYGYTGTTAHPRDGLCTVLVYTRGEEEFDDTIADGVYVFGEDQFLTGPDPIPNYDTPEDPFYDYNDNDAYDGAASLDPEEIFIDADSDGWTDGDGVWSADTYIFRNFKILVTGAPITSPIPAYNGLLPATAYSFAVPDGGSQSIGFLVCDRNFNQLVGGSSVEITSTVGGLAGLLSREYADSNQVGPDEISHRALIEYIVTIYDDAPGDADPPAGGEVTIDVTWAPEGQDVQEYSLTIPGTVD